MKLPLQLVAAIGTGQNTINQKKERDQEHAVIIELLEESINKRNHITKILSNVTNKKQLNNERVGRIYNHALGTIKSLSVTHKKSNYDPNKTGDIKEFQDIPDKSPKFQYNNNNAVLFTEGIISKFRVFVHV